MTRLRRAFTLIELLIVVAIIAILAAIGAVNYRHATDRALKSAGAANMRTIATALQMYMTDFGKLPPADHEAGPFPSHGIGFTGSGNGPAAGGSWDGVPWVLVERGYIGDSRTLFSPRYLRKYSGGTTIRGNYPRYHNFRYAYNAAGLSGGYLAGGDGNAMSGTRWLVRDLFLPADRGFYGGNYPDYPADYTYPWGDGEEEGQLEQVMFADFAVRTVKGGTTMLAK